MFAFLSVWIGVFALGLAVLMVVYRPAFTDWTILLVVYFGTPGAWCLAGMVLWALRKEDASQPGVRAQRIQAMVGIVLGAGAAAIVYLLVIFSTRVPRFEG